MAKFDSDVEHVTSKEKSKKTENNRENDIIKKPIDKRKMIVYGVFGLITLIVFSLMAVSLKDNTEKEVTEIETPMSEADKYNSKLEALGEENKKDYNQNVDLEKTFSNENEKDKTNNESEKLKQQIEAMKNKPVVNDLKEEKPQYKRPNTNHYVNNSPKLVEKPIEKVRKPIETVEEVKKGSGFFSKSTTTSKTTNELIFACIHSDQTVLDGNRVKMRLTKSCTINDNYYPVNTILYGTAQIKPNRLIVSINKINQTEVALQIFDAEDSNAGIYVETPTLNATLKKELQKDALGEDDLKSVPFSKTLTNLLTKKAKEERIELLNNYKIIIKNDKKNK